METNRIKKVIAILLVVLFLVTLTVGEASAGGWGGWYRGVNDGVSPEYQTYNMYMHDGLGDGLRIDSSKNTQLHINLQKGPVLLK